MPGMARCALKAPITTETTEGETCMLDISVVVPAHNSWHFLQQTLPVLLQEPVREVIVVSNGCTDGTAQHLRAHFPQVRCVELPCGNLSAAREYGLRQASGAFVAFRDADDYVIPGGIALQHACLQREAGLDLVGGQTIWRVGQQEVRRSHYWCESDMVHAACLFQAPLLLCASMLRRERFVTSAWGALYTPAEDWDFVWRHLQRGLRMGNVPEPVLYYQRHPDSMTAAMAAGNALQDFVSVLRMQFLLQSGVLLTAEQMRLFVNIAPCEYWALHDVAWLRTVPDVLEATRALLAQVQRQNTAVPSEALARICAQIESQVAALPWRQGAAERNLTAPA